MPEPTTLAVLAGIGTAVNTTVTFARFVHELKSTPVDVKTCLDLVSRVDKDIQFCVAQRVKHLKHLSSTPDQLERLNGIIASANQSILDVGRLLEGCRREAHGGQVPMKGRVKWVMGDSTAFARRTANLQQQHAAINVEIAFLRQLEALQPVKDFVTSSTTVENPELISMGRRRSTSKLPTFSEIDLIDLNPPPEYSPPVPPKSMYDGAQPEFVLGPVDAKPAGWISVPRVMEPSAETSQNIANGEEDEEDPEVAFYRELRQQEEERRQQRGSRSSS